MVVKKRLEYSNPFYVLNLGSPLKIVIRLACQMIFTNLNFYQKDEQEWKWRRHTTGD